MFLEVTRNLATMHGIRSDDFELYENSPVQR